MSDKPSSEILNRRKFLGAATLAGASAVIASRSASAQTTKPDPLITDVQDWQRYLGDGVDKRPYGTPSKFEKAVIRRDVPWLTASAESSVNFTPLHEPDGVMMPSSSCSGVKLTEDSGDAVSHGTSRRMTAFSNFDGMP